MDNGHLEARHGIADAISGPKSRARERVNRDVYATAELAAGAKVLAHPGGAPCNILGGFHGLALLAVEE